MQKSLRVAPVARPRRETKIPEGRSEPGSLSELRFKVRLLLILSPLKSRVGHLGEVLG